MSGKKLNFRELGIDVDLVVDAMKRRSGVAQDVELSDILAAAAVERGLEYRIRPNTVAMWRKREQAPFAYLWLWAQWARARGQLGSLDQIIEEGQHPGPHQPQGVAEAETAYWPLQPLPPWPAPVGQFLEWGGDLELSVLGLDAERCLQMICRAVAVDDPRDLDQVAAVSAVAEGVRGDLPGGLAATVQRTGRVPLGILWLLLRHGLRTGACSGPGELVAISRRCAETDSAWKLWERAVAAYGPLFDAGGQ